MGVPFLAIALLCAQHPAPNYGPPADPFVVVELMRKSSDAARRREEADQKDRAEAARKACALATEAMLAAGDVLNEARLAVRADYRASHSGNTVNAVAAEHDEALWKASGMFWKAEKRRHSACAEYQ